MGESQYSFLLAPEGTCVDDIWVYRLERGALLDGGQRAQQRQGLGLDQRRARGRVLIDPARPWSRALGTETVVIRDMRDPAWASDMRAQLALQGPRSRDILLALLADGDPLREPAAGDAAHRDHPRPVGGYDLYLARTGYTGEPMAFEIFVHPAAAPALWHALLAAGAAFGLQPVGLAARDSLRIEAGLPLYGHELAGPLDLNPADAGFAPYVKLYKPFFIGKAAFMAHERTRQARLIRFRLDEEHARMPSQGDVIVNRKGRVVGSVTSCSIDTDGRLTGLGYVQDQVCQDRHPVGRLPAGQQSLGHQAAFRSQDRRSGPAARRHHRHQALPEQEAVGATLETR